MKNVKGWMEMNSNLAKKTPLTNLAQFTLVQNGQQAPLEIVDAPPVHSFQKKI